MMWKWIGAILVITGCGGFGFSLAASYKKEELALRQLIHVLNYMECELQYRLTPLPELCRQAGAEAGGPVQRVLTALAEELEHQISPDAASCMTAALRSIPELPRSLRSLFRALGQTLGRFDLPGQLQGLEAVRSDCRRALEALTKNRDVRIRSYQTLGLCAGAALAILFL